MASTVSLENLIRKLRKKLRQIENLERLNRPLLEEEIIKVQSKFALRDELKANLEALHQLEKVTEADGEESEENDDFPAAEEDVDVEDDGEYNENSVAVGAEDPSDRGDAEVSSLPSLPSLPSGKVEVSSGKPDEVVVSGSKKGEEAKAKPAKLSLARAPCRVTSLDGHSDLVTSLAVVGGKVISASRDTTLRCWDIATGKEEKIFGGHTETVTCVIVLDKLFSRSVADTSLSSEDHLIVSGSFDSSYKLWSLNSGQMVKSVYTFNPVTCIHFSEAQAMLITGSDGGKLELWDLASGSNLWSNIVHRGSVTGVKVVEKTVFSSSADGVLKVHHVADDRKLSCVFESENLKSASGRQMNVRHVRCLEYGPKGLFYGDDSRNIKIVDWRKGIANKVPNHGSSFTSIDAICCHDDYLVSSSYDLDNGLGYINVRSSRTLEYLATIDDRETERIVCLAISKLPSGNFYVVSGGMELKVWEVGNKGGQWRTTSLIEDADFVKLLHKGSLSRTAIDSETDVSDEEEDDDDEDDDGDDASVEESDEDPEKKESGQAASWMSWCAVL
ncbi:WD repeat-containing protein 5B [Aplysia californica]|uniref:WD repeat-containing protein 5B n=1 Tax=Aplysia californica TaxID=6500 RepID=A0ABM1A814_APLCA|nr:WD repeat-containing protein 5B [Aplysia californica]